MLARAPPLVEKFRVAALREMGEKEVVILGEITKGMY